MIETIKKLLLNEGIELCAPIPMSKCTILRQYKLEKAGFGNSPAETAFMIAVPYFNRFDERNLSAYAASKDYHGFFDGLFAKILPTLREIFPQHIFAGFADNSPIAERDAAARAGLGIIGDNGMLITEKYSSFVFLGEIITDATVKCNTLDAPERCHGCGACKRACPMTADGCQCLSSLTQKKGELTKDEQSLLKKYGSAWGCDICQEVCPLTKAAINSGTIYTEVPYFKTELIPVLSREKIENMTDSEFAARAFSWRGRETVMRNIDIIQNDVGE